MTLLTTRPPPHNNSARWLIAASALGLLLFPALVAAQVTSPAQPLDAIRNLLPGTPAAGDSKFGLKVTKGNGTLPNQHGQVWREYDLTPYTSRITGVARPEQAIVDWILRETGTETWFGTPLGILSADANTLRVYHTPEVQNTVRDIVERFVAYDPTAHTLTLRIVTVSNPAWRTRATALLKPVDVQSSGVDAWLVSHENSAMLQDELKRRADFKELAAVSQPVLHGQTLPLSQVQPKTYIRWLKTRPDGWSGTEPISGTIEEGFTLKLSPLMSADSKTVEANFQCTIDQIEKLVNVPFDTTVGGQPQRAQIQVPQVVSWRLTERFRWPTDQVLLLSCGVIASPTGEAGGALSLLKKIDTRATNGSRSDALVFVEFKRNTPGAAEAIKKADATISTNPVSRGRY
ncbi:hypothetical protein [Anatilimnocola floriformis]|uniref:hypothetical protein n=1 Tax=Anatilimnocola floriformis TaxID=2948575 RepID=UPI0020C26761|nr:hypothetical protein [Anatilimnocola floriformis]